MAPDRRRAAAARGSGRGLLLLALWAAALSPTAISQAAEDDAEGAARDPYQAYAQGQYDRALEAFVDQQVARPDDPAVHLNLGSTYYKLDDFQAAEREYGRAAATEKRELRAEALYNLGNTAYRQGRLEEAIERYRSALDLAPDDQDAKYNLEFVERELERRRQQAQQQEQEPQEQEQENEQQSEEPSPQQKQPEPEESSGEQQEQQEQQEGEQQASEPRDSDGDGLPDQVERRGKNPTDPSNPDTDGDGRSDGEEDRNANGEVDPGETDPAVPDQPSDAASAPPPSGDPTGEVDPSEMTPEQAQRYLQALEEERPEATRAKGRVRRLEKDW